MVISEPTLKRDITNTFIPRGDENEYTNTLKPIPTLHRVVQDTTSESIMHYEIESPDDRTTITTSAPSVDALPNFQFPVVNDPVIVPKSASTIKRIATIDSNRIHLEKDLGKSNMAPTINFCQLEKINPIPLPIGRALVLAEKVQ